MSESKADLSDTTPKGFPFVMPTLFEPFDMSLVKAMLMEFLATCLFLVRINLGSGYLCIPGPLPCRRGSVGH
jgi:hypothetical protein